MDSRLEDEPRSLKRQDVRKERTSLLDTPRVAELTAFVKDMREKTGHGENVPYFDPLDGGVEARCLFLFEAAGGKAVESGFASRNNNDASAEAFFRINKEVGFDRTLTASWNIVPWALRETGKNRKPTPDEVRKGLDHLTALLGLLRALEVVVLCGDFARRATPFLYTHYPEMCVLHAPHPSPQSLNQPGKRDYLRAAIAKAARRVS